jgi:DNA-binding XRE family transcriptional regulator
LWGFDAAFPAASNNSTARRCARPSSNPKLPEQTSCPTTTPSHRVLLLRGHATGAHHRQQQTGRADVVDLRAQLQVTVEEGALKAFNRASCALKSTSMTTKNALTTRPPFAIEQALKRLGANLRVARIRRSLTIQQAAEKIGTGVRAVADAEKGKPSTSVAVYVALLWLFGLMTDVELLADPGRDAEGLSLALRREGTRARPARGLDNDF